jgi:hypothetical protein
VLPVRWQKSGEKTPTESDSSEEEEQGGGNSTSPISAMHNPSVVW